MLNGLLERGFVMSKVDTCLFISNNFICEVYVDDCIFWARSQYDIDKIMKSFKEDGTSYNREHLKGELVSEFLGIDTKALENGGFQTWLIRKVLEATGMVNCNGFPTPTKVEALLGGNYNDTEARIYFHDSFELVIGMKLYLEFNTIPDTSFDVYQWAQFTHNTNA